MKRTILLLLLLVTAVSSKAAEVFDLTANGTAKATLTLNQIFPNASGTFVSSDYGSDQVKITQMSSTGDLGALKIVFQRSGRWNQTYTGWVSSDRKQIAGYYIHNGQQFPFSAKKSN